MSSSEWSNASFDADWTASHRCVHSNTDVLIVGAGPVGLTLALLLAKRGRSVAIYERWEYAYPLPRAAAMSHETVRTFQSAGVLEQLRPFLDLELKKLVASFYGPDGEVLMSMTFPGVGESGYPPMIGFNQPDVDRFLAELCDAHPLIELHRGWSARAIEPLEEYTVVMLDPVNGSEAREGRSITAWGKFVVGCDGANSVIRSLTNTDVVDTGFSSTWLVIDTFPVAGVSATSMFGHVLDPARPATLAPAGKDRQRFEFMLMEGDDPQRIVEEEAVWSLLKRWDVTPEKVAIARRAIYTFRGRWAASWRKGRVLLAGDAAHQMPPFMGQGFNSGVRDAIALAWRLDLILGDRAHEDLLESYTSERLHHVKQIIETSVAVGQMICITDPVAADERNAAFRLMRDTPDMSMPQPDWQLGPGCLMPDDPAAGFLAQQALVEHNGLIGLLDDLIACAGHFVLIGYNVDPLADLSTDALSVWSALDGIAVIIGDAGCRDVDGAYAAWFDKLGASVVMSRPDFQVYGATRKTVHVSAMVITLAQQLKLKLPELDADRTAVTS